MSPRLSGYSVHNIYSSGVGVIPHPMRSRYSYTETDGHSIEYLALSMVTAPPPFITCTGSRVFNRIGFCLILYLKLDKANKFVRVPPDLDAGISRDGLLSSILKPWCPHHESNTGPTDYKSVALPAELYGHCYII